MKLRKILLASTLSIALAITAAVPAFAETEEAVPISADADMPIMVQSQNIKTVLPKLTAKSYSYSKNKLSWDKVDGASGYQIYRATKESGKYTRIATVGAEKTEYINTKLTCGKTYYYKLRAYQVKNGKKVYSKYSTKISCYAKPNKVKNVNASHSTEGLTFELHWNKVSGASGYQLQVKPASTNTWSTYYREKLTTGEWNNTFPDEWKGKNYRYNVKYITLGSNAYWNLPYEEDSYSFRVRAYKTVNGKKVFGLYSEPTTIFRILCIPGSMKTTRPMTWQKQKITQLVQLRKTHRGELHGPGASSINMKQRNTYLSTFVNQNSKTISMYGGDWRKRQEASSIQGTWEMEPIEYGGLDKAPCRKGKNRINFS